MLVYDLSTLGDVMKLRSMMLGVMALLLVVPAAQAAPADRSISSVWSFATGMEVPGASSQLVRTNKGISMSLRTNGLPAGDAVTVWWVIFNNPDACTTGEGGFRCGEGDLFNPAVEASVQNAGGHVVGNGRYAVGSYLSEGDTSGCALAAFDLLCTGLIDASVADVHLVVRSHGPALPAFLPDQFKSFGGACGNEPEELGGGGPNTCEDLQFAVHETI
jgi:hypothetical protein